jgi:streptogramin lyase
MRLLAARAAVLLGLPILILSLAVGTAAASGAGKVKIYTGKGISAPSRIAAGPDGALWFTNLGDLNGTSIGRITTTVTPAVGHFTPASGAPGTTVTIPGQNLSGATKVAFNGTTATIVSDTAAEIVTEVPAGATTGHISVTTPAGTATSSATFTVT